MFNQQAIHHFMQYAHEQYPNEACGFIVSGNFLPVYNMAEHPGQTFKMPSTAWGKAKLQGTIEAVVHSHPDGLDAPSKADMEQQIASALPWGICVTTKDGASQPFFFGDQLAPEPIFTQDGSPNIKRFFRHGVWDCYSLIRDYYRMHKGIILKEFPRDWEWWLGDERLYETGFALAGFKEIPLSLVCEGDVLLGKTSHTMPAVNHGGIYLGGSGQQFIHHLTSLHPVDKSRPVRISSVVTWRKHITHYLRYVG